MAKITKFGHDASFFYDRAMTKSDLNDDIACLDSLDYAQRLVERFSPDDIMLRIERADALARMGLVRESNREFFRAFPYAGEELSDIFYGLIRNFLLTANMDMATYYLASGIESGVLSEDEIELDEELLSGLSSQGPTLVKSKHNEYMLDVAKQLMAGKDIEYARQMLLSVEKDSENFIEASNCLALIALSQNNSEESLAISERALDVNPDDVGVLVTKILALKMAGRDDEIQTIFEHIDTLELERWHEFVKLTLCCAEIDNSEGVYRYSKRALSFAMYEREILLFYALAAANLGYKNEAKTAIHSLVTIYKDDYILKVIARRIDNKAQNEALEFTNELLPAEKEEALKIIDIELNNISKGKCCDQLFKEVFLWAVNEHEDSFCESLIEKLLATSEGLQVLLELLADSEIFLSKKKVILSSLLQNTKLKKVFVVVNNQAIWLSPKVPRITSDVTFINAYWKVYASLAFIEVRFNYKLNSWYKKVATALLNEGLDQYNANAIAAVVAFKSKTSKIFELSSHCCEVFDCPMQDFMLYLNIVDKFQSLNKGKNTRSDANND